MKIFAFIFLVCVVVTVTGSPAKKKIEPKCDIVCTANYEPVCGAVPGDKSVTPKMFGNACVMSAYNCEHKSNLVKVPNSECKNAGGIRLS